MRRASHGAALHLTYCTNIHPGESWDEVRANLETHVRDVKRRVSPEQPFGVGLRLSAAAAEALDEPARLASLREWLDAHGLYVFTINGFPHGRFHGTAVKEQVYRPDWLEEPRLVYTDRLARILSALLPEGVEGSISSVPGCFRARAAEVPEAEAQMAARLVRQVATLVRIAEEGGPVVGLALEPEPFCVWQTTEELVGFFERELFSERSETQLAALTGAAPASCAALLRRHLGMCLDACHAAVEYEDPSVLLDRLAAAGVRVLKLQVTAGLRLAPPTPASLAALARFADGVYLHQTVVRRGAAQQHFVDLPEALAACEGDPGDEWRVHFHVPVFTSDLTDLAPGFSATQGFLEELLTLAARRRLTAHYEVETYTWDVLPPDLRTTGVDEAIARELRWTDAVLSSGR